MKKFDSKIFNGEAFGKYVDRIPNEKKNQLAKSAAVGSNENARQALASQTGSFFSIVPFFGRISGSTSQNNDGNHDIQSTSISTFGQGFVVASRMDGWTEKSFAKSITAGVDFMDEVAKQISEYKQEVKQDILLAILRGIFSMNTEGETVAARANKEFIEKHTFDITGSTENVDASSLNAAIQKAGGDNKDIFTLVIMHSAVSTNLENLKLLSYLKYTDKDGVSRELGLGTWNGRLVLVDDNLPVSYGTTTYKKTTDAALVEGKTYYTRSGSSSNYKYTAVANPSVENIGSYYEAVVSEDGEPVYTTYVLGKGSIVVDDIGDEHAYEMSRDPKVNGGQDTLYVRDRFICGAEGISFVQPASLAVSVSNADLANGENWTVINDGTKAIPTKAIPIARIISKG